MQLTDLDETLLHQAALPFALAAVSDHRFYDRYYINMFAPDGSAAIIHGMGVYKNMNVMDGFACTLSGNVQANHRFSRPLHPDVPGLTMELGPMRAEISEPYKAARYVVDPVDGGDGFDIRFTASTPAHLEHPHVARSNGRLHTDYLRQSQFGHMNGTARIGGRDIDVKDWFVWRDHSWGVRPGIGGFEPGQAGAGVPSAMRAGGLGMLLIGFNLQTASLVCSLQIQENEHGHRYYSDGVVMQIADGSTAHITGVDHDVSFHPGTRQYKTARLKITTDDGKTYDLEAEGLGEPWSMRGAGYDGGFDDGKGHGALRTTGPLHVEIDRYDLPGGDAVKLPDGEIIKPRHREQIAKVRVNGEPGFSHSMIAVSGRNARYGFA